MKQKIIIPTNCPACDSILELVNDQLFCRNNNCIAILDKRIEHFAKTLGIKGLGKQTIQKLELDYLLQIYDLSIEQLEAVVGEKTAIKLFNEIEKSKNNNLSSILASFSIPLVGKTASEKLAKVVSNIDEITAENCKKAGLGEKATSNIINWINTEYLDIKEYLPFTYNVEQKEVVSSVEPIGYICITGKLKSFKTKAEATEILENLGYVVSDNITKQTEYLVDEDNKGSSKRKKAEELGLIIIENLNKFIEESKYD